MSISSDYRFDALDREQLAAQVVAVMSAHFRRPSQSDKLYILQLAADQVKGEQPELAQPDQAPDRA